MGRKRRFKWDMFSVVELRDATAELLRANVGDYEPGSDEARDAAFFAESLATAPVIWADKEFTAYSLDASRDVPDVVSFVPPMPRGLLALARPLPHVEQISSVWQDFAESVPVHAVWWSMSGESILLSALTCDVRFECQPRPFLWIVRHTSVGRGWSDDFESAIMGDEDLSGPVEVPLGDLKHLGAVDFPWVRWLAVAWELLREPRVTASREIDLVTGVRADPQNVSDPAAVVSVKSIRPLEHRPTTAGEGQGREFSRRWVVRGHWRNQAVGTGRADRRVTWIPSHIKGPADKPLARPDVVWRWSE